MIKLVDNRPNPYQWDTNAEVEFDGLCDQFHFANRVYGRSINVKAEQQDGKSKCLIPIQLLQSPNSLDVFVFIGTAEKGYTKVEHTFKVEPRNKPNDYVFTPAEQMTIEEIEKIANNAMEVAQSVRDDADAGKFKGDKGDKGADGKDGVQVNDNATNLTETWSSQKIANEVDTAKNLVVTTTQSPLGGFICDYSSSEIRNALISNRLVEMHFEDTIENSGNQVYPFLKFKNNVAYFRRVQVLKDYTRQIDIMVNYDKSVTFEEHKFYGGSYADLPDKPKINGVELIGDKSLNELESKYKLIERIEINEPINRIDRNYTKPLKNAVIVMDLLQDSEERFISTIFNSNMSKICEIVLRKPSKQQNKAVVYCENDKGIWKPSAYNTFSLASFIPQFQYGNILNADESGITQISLYQWSKKDFAIGTVIEIWGIEQ